MRENAAGSGAAEKAGVGREGSEERQEWDSRMKGGETNLGKELERCELRDRKEREQEGKGQEKGERNRRKKDRKKERDRSK